MEGQDASLHDSTLDFPFKSSNTHHIPSCQGTLVFQLPRRNSAFLSRHIRDKDTAGLKRIGSAYLVLSRNPVDRYWVRGRRVNRLCSGSVIEAKHPAEPLNALNCTKSRVFAVT